MRTVLLKTDESPVAVVARFGDRPRRNRIVIGNVAHEGVDRVGWTFGPYLLAELVEVDRRPPGEFYHHVSETAELVDTTYTITHVWEPWTQAEIDEQVAIRREAAVNKQVDSTEAVMRATILVIMDEFNRHSEVHTAILRAAAEANNLADFKNRMGEITPIPERTTAQLRDAIRAKLGE